MKASGSGPISRLLASPGMLAFWCILASFGTYACMYGFRKPFTAATYAGTEWGDGLKVWYVTAQVLGYTVSKFIGIKIVSEMPPGRRAKALLAMIGFAHVALLGFALGPPPTSMPWVIVKACCLFANGLPLGMVFGMVLGFLEGRRMTELFVAGLCTSFIFASGITKSVGAWLLEAGVPDHWMPFTAGGIFLLPLVVFVWMLSHIPPPDEEDLLARSPRTPMTGAERWAMLRRHGLGLIAILVAYLLITVLRSVRDDFAPEIWLDLGIGDEPGVFARSETLVGLVVLLLSALAVFFKDNRRGFFSGLWTSLGGAIVAAATILGWQLGWLEGHPFAFMVLLGIGMYLPYVAVHTVLFERLIALTREKSNMGFLMYLADSAGYLGFCALMLAKSRDLFETEGAFLPFFLSVSTVILVGSLFFYLLALMIYRYRFPRHGSSSPL